MSFATSAFSGRCSSLNVKLNRDAAKRELREECSIEIEVDKVVNVVDNIILDERGRIRFHYVVVYLLARYVSGEVHPSSDASEVLWATREELDTLNMHPLARKTTQQAFEMGYELGFF